MKHNPLFKKKDILSIREIQDSYDFPYIILTNVKRLLPKNDFLINSNIKLLNENTYISGYKKITIGC